MDLRLALLGPGGQGGFLEEEVLELGLVDRRSLLDEDGEMAFASVARCPGPRHAAVRKCL